MNISNAEFIKSAVKANEFLYDGLPQIVFSGRSNVGKSSVINRLLNRKNFARTSSVPGKTAHINYFLIDKAAYFTDLPGYGYAKVSEAEKQRWAKLMEDYFASKGLISLGVLIVDSRHKPTNDDITMSNWFKSAGCPYIVAANKCDKLKKGEIEEKLEVIKKTLEIEDGAKLLLFSAENGTGRDELRDEINNRVLELSL